jgi:hypothetical protein
MNLEDYIRIIDNKVSWNVRNDFLLNYYFLIDKNILNQNPKTIKVLVFPSEEFRLNKVMDSKSKFEYEYWKPVKVVWQYSIEDYFEMNTNELIFDFWIVGYINLSKNYFNTEIIDPFKYHLKKVQDLKLHTLKQLDIPSLSSYTSPYINDSFTNKFIAVCRKKSSLREFNDFGFANDLIYTSQDLCFILAELNLFKPYLRNLLDDTIMMGNDTVYRYFPTFYDKQYFHLASNYLQTVYNFWDRIGDLLFLYFDMPKIKSERDVFFDRIINQFPTEHKNEDFKVLLDFCENDFKRFNKERKQIVHYQGVESKVFNEWIENATNREAIEQLQAWKIALIDDFLDLRAKSFLGLESAMKLIESKNNCS